MNALFGCLAFLFWFKRRQALVSEGVVKIVISCDSLLISASNSPSSRPCILNVILDNAGQVHHFNPGGGVPAWLINRLAEGKPLAFVQRLEKVAAQWDGQTKTTKGLLSDGAGFGEHGMGSIGLARRTVEWELLRCSILMTGSSV